MSCPPQDSHDVDLKSKVALVTGANTGIGYITALQLARMGARVFVHGRNKGKVDEAVESISALTESDRVEGLVADLSEMAKVRSLADEVKGRTDRLDILVNNAGLILGDRVVTTDGLETTFAVNHMAPFVLTHALADPLFAAAPSRVVTVASDWHRATSGLDFDDLQHEKAYDGKLAYQRSKLANIYFGRVLAKRWADRGVTSNTVHPGVVRTRFGQDGDMSGFLSVLFKMARPFFLSPKKGARTSVYLAVSPDVSEVSGRYFSKCRPVDPSEAAQDDVAAERLWELSEEIAGSIQ